MVPNPWVWLTVGLSATLDLVIARWLLVRADQARTVDSIRTTEVELDRSLDELSESAKKINDTQVMH